MNYNLCYRCVCVCVLEKTCILVEKGCELDGTWSYEVIIELIKRRAQGSILYRYRCNLTFRPSLGASHGEMQALDLLLCCSEPAGLCAGSVRYKDSLMEDSPQASVLGGFEVTNRVFACSRSGPIGDLNRASPAERAARCHVSWCTGTLDVGERRDVSRLKHLFEG